MVVEIVVIDTVFLHKERVGGPRGAGVVAVGAQLGAGGGILTHQPLVVVEKVGAGAVYFLEQPSAKGVVAVGADGGARLVS
jgi:hypothetical protein